MSQYFRHDRRFRRFTAFAGCAAMLASTLAAPASRALVISQPPVFRMAPTVRTWNDAFNGDDAAMDVTANSRGQAVAAGYFTRSGWNPRSSGFPQKDFSAVRAGAGGWVRHYGSTYFDDQANAVAVDGQDNVIAAGYVSGIGPTGAYKGHDFAVVKWDSAGNRLWACQITGNPDYLPSDDEAFDVAVDSRGDVIAVGVIEDHNADASGQLRRDKSFAVVKIAGSNGAVLWQQHVNGTEFGFDDGAASVAIDPQDNIVATGFVQNNGTDEDIAVGKWDTNGNGLWNTATPTPANDPVRYIHTYRSSLANGNQAIKGNDQGNAIAVDTQGNVMVAGFMTNPLTAGSSTKDRDFWVARIASNGALTWQDSLDGTTSGGADMARSVDADPQGNLIAGGLVVNTGAGQDFAVAKWTAAGARSWQRILNGTANGEDVAISVAVDSAGRTLAGGSMTNTGTGRDFKMAVLDTAGVVTWTRETNGTANGDDVCRSVFVDRSDYQYGAGKLRNNIVNTLFVNTALDDFAIAY